MENHLTIALTDKELQVIRCIREAEDEAEDGEVIIYIERNEPCRVEVLQRNIPLE